MNKITVSMLIWSACILILIEIMAILAFVWFVPEFR